MYATVAGIVGNPPIQFQGFDPSTTQEFAQGTIVSAIDGWWGAGEFIYAKASGSIRRQGLCVITPAFNSSLSSWDYEVTEVPNTANLGRMLCVSMVDMVGGEFGWFQIGGICPINCQAAVSADTTFGIAAAGQGGANSAGKQVLNARIIAASTTTVAKANCSGRNGSFFIDVPDADGWFPGVYLSGTGVGSGALVEQVMPGGRQVKVSVANSAAVTGTVTATYNNSTIYYNVAHINRPFAQGAIT